MAYELQKAEAIDRTQALEAERGALSRLLEQVAGFDTSLDWSMLKQRDTYALPEPSQPVLKRPPSTPPPLPPAPHIPPAIVHVPEPLIVKWTTLERAVPLLRRNKEAAAKDETVLRASQAAALNDKELAKQHAAEERRRQEEAAHQRASEKYDRLCELVRRSNDNLNTSYFQAVESWRQAKALFLRKQESSNKQVDEFRTKYIEGDPLAIRSYVQEILNRSKYPASFPRENSFEITSEKTLIIDYELPSLSALPSTKEVKYITTRASFQEVPLSDAWRKKTHEDVLYQVCLRTVYELFRSDAVDAFRTIVFNGWVRSLDRATGAPLHSCIMSLEVGKDEFLALDLAKVDPKSCFRKLKGVAASKLAELSPIKPLVVLNTEDKRFVDGYSVTDLIDERTNLAAMDWVDFENLIREVFEKATNGWHLLRPPAPVSRLTYVNFPFLRCPQYRLRSSSRDRRAAARTTRVSPGWQAHQSCGGVKNDKDRIAVTRTECLGTFPVPHPLTAAMKSNVTSAPAASVSKSWESTSLQWWLS